MRSGTPTYDLRRVQQLVGQGPLSRSITTAAVDGADRCGFVLRDIVQAVLALSPEHFYKSMESEKMPGFWQDVYHLEYRDVVLYIKLQIGPDGRAVVVQFKEK